MLVAELDGQVAGWLTARIEDPAPGAARQMVREPGLTRLIVDALMVDQAVWREGWHMGYQRRSIVFQKWLR